MAQTQAVTLQKTGEPLLVLEGVGYHYPSQLDGKLLLTNINLKLHRGDVITIRGRNGSGKTTLLKLLAGQMQPVTGSITRYGNDIRIVYLNQHASDFVAPALSVREQLMVGMGNRLAPLAWAAGDTMSHKVKNILAQYEIGLPDKLDAFTSELSGGQRQVVALVAALASNADVLLLDEYSSFMDSATTVTSNELLQHIFEVGNLAVVVVDHSGWIECKSTNVYDI